MPEAVFSGKDWTICSFVYFVRIKISLYEISLDFFTQKKTPALKSTTLFTWYNCKIPWVCVQKHSLESMGPLTIHCAFLVNLWAIMLLLCHSMGANTLWQQYWKNSSVHRSYRCPQNFSWISIVGSMVSYSSQHRYIRIYFSLKKKKIKEVKPFHCFTCAQDRAYLCYLFNIE